MAFGNKDKKEQQKVEEDRRAAELRERDKNRKASLTAQREIDIREFTQKFDADVRSTVLSGTPVTLFREKYVPVDAQMNQFGPPAGLHLGALNGLGRLGWAVVSVIPRTYGGFEVYKISKTTAYGVSGYGKDEHKVGLGGHIVGVYVLMSYTVTKENLESSEVTILEVVAESMPENLLAPIT